MAKFINVTRSDFLGEYIQDAKMLPEIIQGELGDLENMKPGTSITLEVVELSQEEFDELEEFTGWS